MELVWLPSSWLDSLWPLLLKFFILNCSQVSKIEATLYLLKHAFSLFFLVHTYLRVRWLRAIFPFVFEWCIETWLKTYVEGLTWFFLAFLILGEASKNWLEVLPLRTWLHVNFKENFFEIFFLNSTLILISLLCKYGLLKIENFWADYPCLVFELLICNLVKLFDRNMLLFLKELAVNVKKNLVGQVLTTLLFCSVIWWHHWLQSPI